MHYNCYNYRCYSYAGRETLEFQPQGLSLGYGCVYNDIVLHELGHAIGFYHEHTRPDRDEYVDVNYDNIVDYWHRQFEKVEENETNTLGYGYDYASIMHYEGHSATINGEATIEATDEGILFGLARELSPLDILKANALYKCGKLYII